jgi:exonuclease SbcC
MIESVEIWNFQSHRHTVLEFVPGTNVIIGLSDAGKSTVFRAINWVLSNRPLGDSYRSEWGGDTHVILRLSDGNVVERFRSASSNEYRVNGETLKAFGSDPPDAVLEVLRMDSANIQAQGAPPFLLSASPGEAARMLNKAASLDEIDKTIANLRKSLQETNRQLEYNTKQKEGLEEELKEYDDLPDLEGRVKALEDMDQGYRERKGTTNALSRLVTHGGRVTTNLAELDHVPTLMKWCVEVTEHHKQLERDRSRSNTLSSIIRQAQDTERALGKTERVSHLLGTHTILTKQYQDCSDRKSQLLELKRLVRRIRSTQEGLDRTKVIDTAIHTLVTVETTLTQYQEVQTNADRLERLILQVEELTPRIDKLDRMIDLDEQEYHKISPDTCPLCGGKMSK